MPFIVTTKQPVPVGADVRWASSLATIISFDSKDDTVMLCAPRGTGVQLRGPFPAAEFAKRERRAVATVEEAREAVFALLREAKAPPTAISVDVDGGSIGPLPGGTVIEVEPVEWYWLYDQSGYGRTSQASDSSVIAAYNAKQA